jgi:hypothetical protein
VERVSQFGDAPPSFRLHPPIALKSADHLLKRVR